MAIIDMIHAHNVYLTDLPIKKYRLRWKSPSYSRDKSLQHFTSSYRPPSRLGDPRPFRSRSHSETKNILREPSNSAINYESHMYHPTEIAN